MISISKSMCSFAQFCTVLQSISNILVISGDFQCSCLYLSHNLENKCQLTGTNICLYLTRKALSTNTTLIFVSSFLQLVISFKKIHVSRIIFPIKGYLTHRYSSLFKSSFWITSY